MSFKSAPEYRDLVAKLSAQRTRCKGDSPHTNCKRCNRAVASGLTDASVEAPKKTRRAKPKSKPKAKASK